VVDRGDAEIENKEVNIMLHDYHIIDLSHTIDENIPTWPGSTRFRRELRADYAHGCRIYDYIQGEGIGTHLDAPAHFVDGGCTIADLKLTELVAPAFVIDVRDAVAKDADYLITQRVVEDWEKQHGLISPGSIFLACTGWSKFWSDEKRYRNSDANGDMHFPGFAKDAAETLVARKVVGVGIDNLSIDRGLDKKFLAHHVLLGHGLYQIENLTGLEQLPATGSIVFALPIKIKDGPEAVARVIALVPK
jgi:kynurenine formamidase